MYRIFTLYYVSMFSKDGSQTSNLGPKTGGPGCNNICVLWMYICALQYMFGCNIYIYIQLNLYIYILYSIYLYLFKYIYICMFSTGGIPQIMPIYIHISPHISTYLCESWLFSSHRCTRQLGPPTRDTSDPCSCVGHILVTHVGQSVPVDGIQKRRLTDFFFHGHGQIQAIQTTKKGGQPKTHTQQTTKKSGHQQNTPTPKDQFFFVGQKSYVERERRDQMLQHDCNCMHVLPLLHVVQQPWSRVIVAKNSRAFQNLQENARKFFVEENCCMSLFCKKQNYPP